MRLISAGSLVRAQSGPFSFSICDFEFSIEERSPRRSGAASSPQPTSDRIHPYRGSLLPRDHQTECQPKKRAADVDQHIVQRRRARGYERLMKFDAGCKNSAHKPDRHKENQRIRTKIRPLVQLTTKNKRENQLLL